MIRPLAPTLRWLIENEWARHDSGVYAEARAEARALLSVARAARDVARGHGEPEEILREPANLSSPQFRSMCKALVRLSRLSTPAGPRGRRS